MVFLLQQWSQACRLSNMQLFKIHICPMCLDVGQNLIVR